MRIDLRQFKDSLASGRRPGKPGEAGLTLIEMLIVLVIIGIVATLVVINVAGRPDEAKVMATKTDLKTLSGALAMYRLDNGDYPSTEQGLKALSERPTTAPVPAAWRPYVQATPKDPFGHPYVYTNTGGSYTLTALGKDGKPGGEGLDADMTERGL
jgi:general secretion pathway protein G